MINLYDLYAAPMGAKIEAKVASMPQSVSSAVGCPRVAKLFLGDEPVVLLMQPHENVLMGVVAHRWFGALDRLLSRFLTKDLDAQFMRSRGLEQFLGVGFVYLSFQAHVDLHRNAVPLTVLRSTLRGLLTVAEAPVTLAGGAA